MGVKPVPVVLSVHAVPVHTACGFTAPLPDAELKPWPVTALQMTFTSVAPSRTSRPLSFAPEHAELVALVVVLEQVSVAPRTI
ncbi:hypothetical protein [Streptomyces sp. NPDC002580]|uniref:hypothetical protein n=1 Tax=Streptomyces sp. NPDC002580 TaxID=3364653 RepID=UPI0036ACCB88